MIPTSLSALKFILRTPLKARQAKQQREVIVVAFLLCGYFPAELRRKMCRYDPANHRTLSLSVKRNLARLHGIR